MSVSPHLANIRRFDLSRIWLRKDVLTASLALNLLGLMMPIAVLQVYDRVLRNQSYDTLWALTAILCAVIAMEFFLRCLRSLILGQAGARYDHRMSLTAFARLLDTDLQYFERQTANAYVDEFRAIQRVKEFYAQQALTLVADLPFLLVFFCLIVFIAGWLAVIPLIFVAAFVAVAYEIAKRTREAAEARDEADQHRYNFLIESLSGIQTVKTLAMERIMSARHERLQKTSASVVERLTNINTQAQGLSAFFAQGATITIVGAGAPVVVSGALSLGSLAATMMLTGRMLQPIVRGFSIWTKYESVRLMESKIEVLFEQPLERLSGAPLQQRMEGEIVFDNVSFRYPDADHDIVANLSLEIAPGEMIGLSGANSCGKTTLLFLINGLLSPTSGRILLDGVDLQTISLDHVRAQVGFAPTEGTLFTGSYLDNLTMFQPGQINNAIEIARSLGLDHYLARLPDGLKTVVGSNGGTPEGVRQRIAIARALVTNPKVLLFDKAYKSLDHESDLRLLQTVESLKNRKTVIMVAERPSYLKLCDRLFTMQDGGLVETAHDALRVSRHAPPLVTAGGAA
ncbi:MAG: peptidase domain-containing ABC transporter [Pseudomonadota bacterium]